MANTIIEGTVSKINGHGFRINEREDWLNISKYAKAEEAPMPTVGARVSITLDGSGFVRKVEELHTAPEPQPTGTTTPGPDAKDVRITRLAVLNTATAILSSGNRATDAKSVVELATRLEAWVLR